MPAPPPAPGSAQRAAGLGQIEVDVAQPAGHRSRLSAADLQHAQDTLAHGRMKRKLLAAREALDGGVTRVTIADGRCAAPLSAALNGAGTTIS